MRRNGLRLPITMQDAFPFGCCLVPGSISEAIDWDEVTRQRSPARDKITGQSVFSVRVSDLDPDLAGRSHEVVVKILADAPPKAPTGVPFEPVEFEGLMVTPYVDNGRCQGRASRCQARMAFSLRATGLKPARPAQDRKDVA